MKFRHVELHFEHRAFHILLVYKHWNSKQTLQSSHHFILQIDLTIMQLITCPFF